MQDGRRDDTLSQELERALRRLPDVSAARVVLDHLGEPVEVHVLARPGKHAKQIVRDIESVSLAAFGLEIDRRIVSIVQLEEPQPDTAAEPPAASPPVAPTPTVARLRVSETGVRAAVEVVLDVPGPTPIRGIARGSTAGVARPRLIAMATLDGLRQIDPETERFDVESASIVRLGEHDIAVVALSVVEERGEGMVAGAEPIADEPDGKGRAVARAVIDAVWRPRSAG